MAGRDPQDYRTLFPDPNQGPSGSLPPGDLPTARDVPRPDESVGFEKDAGKTAPKTGPVPKIDGTPKTDAVPKAGGSKPVDENPAFAATAASIGVSEPESVKKLMIDLQLITEADWQAAVAACGGSEDPRKVLYQLQKIPARWGLGSGDVCTALTPYQVDQILANRADRLRLQHYVLLDRLGAGGMGEVFKARNLNLPRLEAIKTILEDGDDVGAGQTQGLQRFEQEARLLAQLDHRYITTVHHAGRDHDINFIAMEYVAGKNLKAIVEETKETGEQIPVWWAVERIIAVAEALQHAHENGVIHRDVKPQNIMITDKNELKVLDLGIARLAGPQGTGHTARLTQNATGLGTPDVMPPEQWADATAVTPASDIYSLGCTLFYAITGQMPFTADTINGLMFAHVNDTPPRASSLRPDVPPGLDDVIATMLAKRPEDRFTSCRDLIPALEPFVNPDQPPPPVVEPNPVYKWALAGVAGVVLAVVASIGTRMLLERNPTPTKDDVVETPIPEKDAIPEKEPQTPAVVKKDLPTPTVDLETSVGDWLTEFQRKNADIWPTRTRLNDFKDKDLRLVADTPESFDKLKTTLESNAANWRGQREKLTKWLQDYQAKNKEVWPDPKRLEDFALADGTDVLFKPNALEQIQERIGQKTETMSLDVFKPKVAKRLADYQKQHATIWTSPENLEAFANGLSPSPDDIRSEASLQDLMKAIETETWSRATDEFVVEFQKTHSKAWPDQEELDSFVKKEFDQAVPNDSASFERFQEAVRRETSKRIKVEKDMWLAAYQRSHAEEWPSLEELTTEANRLIDPAALVDDKAFASLTDGVEKLTAVLKAPPFEGVRYQPVGNPAQDYTAETFLHTYQWLLGLSPSAEEKNRTLEVRFEVDGQEVKTVKSDIRFQVSVKSPVKGYLTIIAFSSTGSQYLLRNDVPLEPDVWTAITRPTADVPGVDTFSCYLTDIDPFQGGPQAPPEVASVRKKFPGSAGLQTPERNEFERIKDLFKSPQVFKKAMERLKEGSPDSRVPANREVKLWFHRRAEITVVP